MERGITTEGYYDSPQESSWNQVKSNVARRLSAAAQTLHRQSARAERPTEVSRFGEKAANWLDRSASYVNEIEPQRLKSDLETTVRKNPGRSLLVAGLAGLVIGKLLRRR